jgi:ATP-dependent helicase/nuclease subunit B
VVLTRARKVEGTPTVPSRWLMRLDRVVEAAGLKDVFAGQAGAWRAWTRALTQPGAFVPGTPPAPKPPVAARPRRLSVTDIEKWMRDPYGIYARRILRLRPLDPLDQDVGAADYGTLIHAALHDFVKVFNAGPLPPDAYDKLCAIGRRTFDDAAARPGVMAFWWPRFERIARWFVETEHARRPALSQSYVEIAGEMTLKAPGGAFTLTAVADRIDRAKDGGIAILDYKTGTPPRETEVAAGFAPQLPLEAAILAAGGFEGVGGAITTLAFWHLHGRGEGGDEKPIRANAATLAADAREGLAQLVAKFDDPATPYEARPNPDFAPAYSDYEHLARVKEWAAGEDEGDA